MSRAAGSSKETAIDLDDSDDEVVCLGVERTSPNVSRGRGFRRDIPIDLDENGGSTRKRRRTQGRRRVATPLKSLLRSQTTPQQQNERPLISASQPPRPLRPPSVQQSYPERSTSSSSCSFSELLSRTSPIAVERDEMRFVTPASSITLVDSCNLPISPLKVKIEASPEPESYLNDEYEFDDALLGPSHGGYVDTRNDAMDLDDDSNMWEETDKFSNDAITNLKDAKETGSKAIPYWSRKPRTLLNGHRRQYLMGCVSPTTMSERNTPVYCPAIEARCPKRGPLGRFSTLLNGSLLRPFVHYAKTSGAVTSIAQSGSNIVVASAADGGMDDSGNLAYNRNKNLMAFRGKHSKVLQGHQIEKNLSESDNYSLYYTVHEVAFDPTNENRFVSVGHEGRVLVWNMQMERLKKRPDDGEDIANECLHEQDRVPCRKRINCQAPVKHEFVKATQSVIFQPETSNFAVSCHDGTIHCIFNKRGRRILKLVKESNSEIAKPGHMVWASGTAQKSNRLYASTESALDRHPCIHAAFDIATSQLVYRFADEDSSDNMVLDSFGKRMALVSESKGTHRLSFFDVARDDGHVTASIELRQTMLFGDSPLKLEVNDASFSPDGNLIALARNDNATDIYDTRFLNRPWAMLPHARSSTVSLPIKDTYGVFGAHWVQGRGWGATGLVTGGADGCVRLWDVYRAPSQPEESTVLAELNSDVANLTIGDPYKGEKRLVVGDCAGEVYIFD